MTESQAEFRARVEGIVADVQLPPQFTVVLGEDQSHRGGRLYLQIKMQRPDTFTGQLGEGAGRKQYLTPWATQTELVHTIWGLYEGFILHEARETFLWRGRRVFGPHIDVQAQWEIAERYDARPEHTSPEAP